MFGQLFTLTFAILLYAYAYRGIINQKRLSDSGRVFKKCVLGITIIVHAVCIYYSFYYYKNTDTYSQMVAEPSLYYEKCGTVTKKLEGYKTSSDNSTKYEEQLVIHYDNGDIERRDVTRKTYDRYKEGGSICFAEETSWNKLWHLMMFFVWVASIVGTLILSLYVFETDFE